ncbi:MAG: hypothetical protein Q4B81_00250 [Moraxella sp.]|nr:hypothetical protein [Moraxella sp.]
MKLPISVYTTITVQDANALNDPTHITGVAIGTSPNRPRITDTTLHKEVAKYPAYATMDDGKLRIYTAMEYGTSLGVYELGIYAGEKLIATINQKSRYEINKPIFALRHDRTYIFDIVVNPAVLDGLRNRGALSLVIDERDDITYPMAMAIQHNAALSMVASEQVIIKQELMDLAATADEHTETLKEHQDKIGELEATTQSHDEYIKALQEMPIMQAYDTANDAKQKAERALVRTDELGVDVDELKIATQKAMSEAQNKVRIKSRHEHLLVMHEVDENKYELTLTDVAKASNLASEVIARQKEIARIREELEIRMDAKMDEKQVRAMIAEAELDDVSRDEIKLKIIEAVAGKMSDERVRELLSHKLDVLEAQRLLVAKADVAHVNEQLATKADDKEVQLQLAAKVDDTEFAQMMVIKANKSDVPTYAEVAQMLSEKGSRIEFEDKIKTVDGRVLRNKKILDEIVPEHTINTEKVGVLERDIKNLITLKSLTDRLVIVRDGDGVGIRLDNTPTLDDTRLLQAKIDDGNQQINDLQKTIDRKIKDEIGKLTDGASFAMDTFAEVEQALSSEKNAAAALLNSISNIQRTVNEQQLVDKKHEQFTGYLTATNMAEIVTLILME